MGTLRGGNTERGVSERESEEGIVDKRWRGRASGTNGKFYRQIIQLYSFPLNSQTKYKKARVLMIALKFHFDDEVTNLLVLISSKYYDSGKLKTTNFSSQPK